MVFLRRVAGLGHSTGSPMGVVGRIAGARRAAREKCGRWSRRGGRVVEGGGLENRRRSRVRGFESLPLRQCKALLVVLASLAVSAPGARADEPRTARIEARPARALAGPAPAPAPPPPP